VTELPTCRSKNIQLSINHVEENTMAGSKAWYYTAVHYVTDEYTYEVRYQSTSECHVHYWEHDETEYIQRDIHVSHPRECHIKF